VLAIIEARGGSKSLPRKNALLGGKPLMAWTIEASRASASIGRTVVTIDDPEIAEVARRYGADVSFMCAVPICR
jgi:CMP-N,N'-diacetyllegionaminic acid synthase